MARKVTRLTEVSLFTHLDDKGHFVIEIDPEPHGRRTKCRIATWPEGELETVERCLSSHGMPVVHGGESQSYFWARSRHLITVVGLVIEAFEGVYKFDPPEFWYHTPDESTEFHLEDTTPHTHTKIMLECTNWDIYKGDEDYEQQLNDFDETLRQSGLCRPLGVYHRDKMFYATLTDEAAKRPLETFLQLVNLHPALTQGAAGSETA